MRCSLCNCSDQLFKMYGVSPTAFRASLVLQPTDNCNAIICEQCIIDIKSIAEHVEYWREQKVAKPH